MSDVDVFVSEVRKDLLDAIENDSIVLPTLPEVALEIRAAANDPDVNLAVLASIIENDSSLVARLIRVANSSLLRGNDPVTDVKTAVSRIGLGYTTTLVTTLAMQQIFLSTSESLNKRMRALWVHSTDIAAICHTLATVNVKANLKPDLATLAGIVHQIGALPILSYAVGRSYLSTDDELLQQVLVALTPEIGRRILESWGFAPELVIVPEAHVDFKREVEKADYADLVTVANLQSFVGTKHPMAAVDWAHVKAFERLGLPVVPGEQDEAYEAQIEQMQELLRG